MAQQWSVRGVATRIKKEGGLTKIFYHETPVVTFGGNKITLNTGGWKTNTTKTRMQQSSHQFGLGFDVFQKKHKWYAKHKGRLHEFVGNVLNLED